MVFVLRGFLCGWWLLRLRLIRCPVFLHVLGKFTYMEKVAAHLGMGFVNITAGKLRFLSPSGSNNNFPSVWNAKQLFVMRVDKADSLFRFCHMLIKPFFHIAVTVKVIVTLCWVAAEQESVPVGVRTEAVLGTVITLKGAFGVFPRKRLHVIAVVQKPLIFTQGVDNIWITSSVSHPL